jgi:ADP-ribose pyrophosphatase YjhB (NUDIX family)
MKDQNNTSETYIPEQIPGNITSVGAFVTQGGAVLVVKLTYGPTKGMYSLPGGWQDVGEHIYDAATREVQEETGIEARMVGLIGLRTRTVEGRSISDLIWLLEHVSGEPVSDDEETEEARFMLFSEVEERDDVEDIVKLIAARCQADDLRPIPYAGRNVDDAPDEPEIPAEEWKLFL